MSEQAIRKVPFVLRWDDASSVWKGIPQVPIRPTHVVFPDGGGIPVKLVLHGEALIAQVAAFGTVHVPEDEPDRECTRFTMTQPTVYRIDDPKVQAIGRLVTLKGHWETPTPPHVLTLICDCIR